MHGSDLWWDELKRDGGKFQEDVWKPENEVTCANTTHIYSLWNNLMTVPHFICLGQGSQEEAWVQENKHNWSAKRSLGSQNVSWAATATPISHEQMDYELPKNTNII